MMIKPYRIVVASIKGGTGKTTSAVSLACILANYEPTLLVDFDPQAQVAAHFGRKQSAGVYEWLMGNVSLSEALYQGRPDALRILPGDTTSKDVGYKFASEGGAMPLAQMLMGLSDENYAFEVYDTAAGGFLQEAALLVADHVVIPFRTEGASVISLRNTLDVIKNSTSAGITLLPVGYQHQYSIHRRNLRMVVGALGDHYAVSEQSAVPHRVAVLEAFAEGLTIWEYIDAQLNVVRAAYARLAARIFELAGYTYLKEGLEKIYYGKN